MRLLTAVIAAFLAPGLAFAQVVGVNAAVPRVVIGRPLLAPAAMPQASFLTLPVPAIATVRMTVPSVAPQAQSVRLRALGEKLVPSLAAVTDLPNKHVESAKSAGNDIINAILGQNDAQTVAVEEPAPKNWGILDKMGVRRAILVGGGIQFAADGSILPVKDPIKFSTFDNDDNVLYYRTKIYIRRKDTKEEIAISTAKFAEVRTTIGKSGHYKNYEFFGLDQPDGGSFRDFMDIKDPEIFPKDVLEAILSVEASMWRGPSWFPWATALADPKRAQWVAVVTSRGHEPKSVVKGFDVLRSKSLLKNSPREELIFGVRTPLMDSIFPPGMAVPEKKIAVLIELLDLIESVPLADASAHHSFGFSDDDVDMITRVKAALAHEQVQKGRWPHIKISIFSTGPGSESRDVLTAPAKKS
jgi:hypothetical protein